MRPRAIWGDLCSTVYGVAAFWRYLHSHDSIDVALGLFEAGSSTAVLGRPCRYVMHVANISQRPWDVNVSLQVSAMTVETVQGSPVARFTKLCAVRPHRTSVIECHYDWRTPANFFIENNSSPPDEAWQRKVIGAQRYVVSAILSDYAGKHLDQLDIYQEMQG